MHSRQIESFIATADAGSFTKAAKALYIAPSSLIQQIDLLEKRLGVTLFVRQRRGVSLTDAGESVYRDAVEIVRLSKEAVARARQIQNGEGSIRVATSLLMKLRLLPGIWAHLIERSPDTRIDIVSFESVGVTPGNYLSGLGVSYDVMEGLYLSELYRDRCTFLELERVPLCIAVAKDADERMLTAVDAELLHDLDLVTMRQGVSTDYDAARAYLSNLGADRITDVPFYTIELFADCALNRRAIVTTKIWEDVHPDLACIPLPETHSIPYGLIFPKQPNPQTMRLYEAIQQMSLA